MSKAMLRLREVKRPISEETIAFRIEAAIPNRAGKAFGKNVPSFRKPYFIAETSDISEQELNAENFEKAMTSFRQKLKWAGYSETYFVGD